MVAIGELLRGPVGSLAINTLREHSIPTRASILFAISDAEGWLSRASIEREIGKLRPDLLGVMPPPIFSYHGLIAGGLLIQSDKRPDIYHLTELGQASTEGFRQYATLARSGLQVDLRDRLIEVSNPTQREALIKMYPDSLKPVDPSLITSRELMSPDTFRITALQSEPVPAGVLAALAALVDLPFDDYCDDIGGIAEDINRGVPRRSWDDEKAEVGAALKKLGTERLVRNVKQYYYEVTPLGRVFNRALGEYIQTVYPVLDKMYQPVRDFIGDAPSSLQ